MSAYRSVNETAPLSGESMRQSQALRLGASKQIRKEKRLRSNLTAQDLMTSSVVTTRPEESVARAARIIDETCCGALPVVDSSGRLIGIITNSDITTRLIARGVNVAHSQVSDCMTEQAFACSADNSIENCLHAMSWHQIKRLPIVDHDHKVIGIICRGDLTRYVCDHAGETQHRLADMLLALG